MQQHRGGGKSMREPRVSMYTRSDKMLLKKSHPERQAVEKFFKEYDTPMKKRKAKAKEYNRTYRKKQRLRKYGLTPETYKEMYVNQKGRCLICKKKPDTLSVDYDHSTRRVRGLLCENCKGMVRSSSELLRKAAVYLKAPAPEEYLQ